MKRSFGSILGFVWLAATLSSPALELSPALREKTQQALDAVWRNGPTAGDTMFLLREAGGAYLPEIVAPVDATKYQDMDRRRLMVGVYGMDLAYASTFHQAEPAARTGQALCALLQDLGHPRPELERQYREALDQIDQPGGEQRLRDLFRMPQETADWQALLDTDEGAELAVDALFGHLIEGLYLASEIAVLSDFEPNYMRFVGDMRNAFLSFKDMLLQFEDEPEFKELIQSSERIQLVTELLALIGDMPEVGPEQVQDLRPVITKTRNDIVH